MLPEQALLVAHGRRYSCALGHRPENSVARRRSVRSTISCCLASAARNASQQAVALRVMYSILTIWLAEDDTRSFQTGIASKGG